MPLQLWEQIKNANPFLCFIKNFYIGLINLQASVNDGSHLWEIISLASCCYDIKLQVLDNLSMENGSSIYLVQLRYYMQNNIVVEDVKKCILLYYS